MANWPRWSTAKTLSRKLLEEIHAKWLAWVWHPFQLHFPRASQWIADWGWAGLMIAAATAAGGQEYLISLVFVVLSAVSLAASSFHWEKIQGWPRLTIVRSIAGVIGAILLMAFGILWIVGLKADQPWSRIPAGWRVVRSFLKKPSKIPVFAGKTNPVFSKPTEPSFPATIRKGGSTKSQYLYIANNGAHSITMYRIHGDGRLTFSKATPFDWGFGPAGPLVTDDNILLLEEPFRSGDPKSSTVSLYKIGPDGSITHTDFLDEPGIFPIALDRKSKFVYVGQEQSISAAVVRGDKFVRSPSTFRPPCPTADLVSPCSTSLHATSLQFAGADSQFLYGIFKDVQAKHFGLLGTITRHPDGTLGRFAGFVGSRMRSRLPCDNFNIESPLPSLIVVSESKQAFAFQSCLDDNGRYTIGSSAVNRSTGEITESFPESQSASGGDLFPILADPSGKWLIACDTQPCRLGKIHVLLISERGSLTPLPKHVFPSTGDLLAFDHSGTFLYMANAVENNVTAFHFDSHAGILSALPGAIYQTDQQPTAMVVARPR